jgi:S1-C subfamily serine protease
VTFDFPKRVMYLKPGKEFAQADSWDLSGLHIWRVNGEIVIDAVDAGSPSESVGLKKNDAFVLVDNLPIAGFSLNRLRAMLRDPTRSVAITVRRGEKTKRVELEPHEFRTKSGAPLESPQTVPGP